MEQTRIGEKGQMCSGMSRVKFILRPRKERACTRPRRRLQQVRNCIASSFSPPLWLSPWLARCHACKQKGLSVKSPWKPPQTQSFFKMSWFIKPIWQFLAYHFWTLWQYWNFLSSNLKNGTIAPIRVSMTQSWWHSCPLIAVVSPVPPGPPYMQVTIEDVQVRDGDLAKFQAVIEGKPQPTVSWYKVGARCSQHWTCSIQGEQQIS